MFLNFTSAVISFLLSYISVPSSDYIFNHCFYLLSPLFSSSFSYITNWVSLSMSLLLIQYHTSPLSLNYCQFWAIWVARSGCQKLEYKLSNLRVTGLVFIHTLLPFSCRSPCILKFCVVILQIFLLASHLAHSRADPWKKMSNEILVRFKVWN